MGFHEIVIAFEKILPRILLDKILDSNEASKFDGTNYLLNDSFVSQQHLTVQNIHKPFVDIVFLGNWMIAGPRPKTPSVFSLIHNFWQHK